MIVSDVAEVKEALEVMEIHLASDPESVMAPVVVAARRWVRMVDGLDDNSTIKDDLADVIDEAVYENFGVSPSTQAIDDIIDAVRAVLVAAVGVEKKSQ